MSKIYLERYAWQQPILNNHSLYERVGMVIVIPCYNEPDILSALESLQNCDPPATETLVLVIINESENAGEAVIHQNQKTFQNCKTFEGWFHLEVVQIKFPNKKAGVGLARKTGMDEAVRIFMNAGKEGLIVCFDADCTCAPNYLTAIESFFRSPENNLGLIYYEHPVNAENQEAIICYELFLRHYINALRYAGFPHAVQTLGSCISVRSSAYVKQGGMNTRKAGEDFYFIHKVAPLGGVGQVNNTCVYPSPRVSDRVPFGTGHAVHKYLTQPGNGTETYSSESFDDLKMVFETALELLEEKQVSYLGLPESVLSFYEENHFEKALHKILLQSNNHENFIKRFYAWWDAFRVLKFIHFARDHFYPNTSLSEGTKWLGEKLYNEDLTELSLKERLFFFRAKDRETEYYIK